ncbi:APC family permease [Couchioplanes azureus]|uniref:APC family permease n=1 Tax=Couchioplanes caeruleus TaxID=56438 RepID=UPI00166F8DC9|nr:APC family permease [Couchioplanes caeruleus]GGQ69057.1 amino acid permease [Couchioplanes caeruleus subsp. azureus]
MPPPPVAAGRLGGASVACFALAAATPLTVVTAVVPGAYADSGLPALPLLFLALGALLLLFLVGCTGMIRRLPGPGALYSFVARGLGRPAGVGAAWLALLSYNALQVGLYGTVGAAAAPLIDAPWWAVAAACWVVVALCGLLLSPAATARLLAVPVSGGIVLVAGYAVANLLDPGGGRVSWAALHPGHLGEVSRPVLGLLLVVGAFAFVGFETAVTHAADVRRPRSTTARAAVASVLLLALLYAAASWATAVATGPGRIAAAAAARGPELAFDLAATRLPSWTVPLGRALVVAGLLAAMLALHHTVVRYLLALGRERVLSAGLGAWRPASLTQSLTGGLIIGGCVLLDRPVVALGSRLAVGGALGIVVLLALASLAALVFLNRHPEGEGVLRRFLAPGVSTVLLGVLTYLAYLSFPELVVAAAATALLGVLYGLVLRWARPVVYAGIGLGGAAVVVAPAPVAVPRPRSPGAHRPERVNRLAG